MPKNKFQDVVFTIIMATVMVYGMVVYNVALNTGGVTGQTLPDVLLRTICTSGIPDNFSGKTVRSRVCFGIRLI